MPAYHGTPRFITVFTRVGGLVQNLTSRSCSQWGVISPSPNSKVGGPPLVRIPRLLVQWMCSYLPSLSGGRLFHPQPEDAPRRGDKDPHDMDFCENEAYCIEIY